MTTPQFYAGSQLEVYSGDVGATADAFTAADGSLTITPANWDAMGFGPFNDGVTWEGLEELTPLMFQGSKGLEDEARITLQGFMMTIPNFNGTPQLLQKCWGGTITTTAAGAAQVGIHRLALDRPLKKPSYGVQIVIDSPFDVQVNGERAKALIYLPKARLSVGAFGMGVDPEAGTGELTIMQQRHTTGGYIDFLFADHT